MHIGERIKARRTELKWSQREFASRLGYADHTTVARIESGKVDPPLSKIAKFAQVLGVTSAYLMGWEQEPEDLGALAATVLKDPDLLSLVKNYSALDSADRATVAALVASLADKRQSKN